jgi:hypothetical protein
MCESGDCLYDRHRDGVSTDGGGAILKLSEDLRIRLGG